MGSAMTIRAPGLSTCADFRATAPTTGHDFNNINVIEGPRLQMDQVRMPLPFCLDFMAVNCWKHCTCSLHSIRSFWTRTSSWHKKQDTLPAARPNIETWQSYLRKRITSDEKRGELRRLAATENNQLNSSGNRRRDPEKLQTDLKSRVV